jgi:hypothetical protein
MTLYLKKKKVNAIKILKKRRERRKNKDKIKRKIFFKE